MTTLNTLTRKLALTLAALVVSAMTLAAANDAKADFEIVIDFGVPGLEDIFEEIEEDDEDDCWYFKKKWKKTGKFYWKKKYFKCMGYW